MFRVGQLTYEVMRANTLAIIAKGVFFIKIVVKYYKYV